MNPFEKLTVAKVLQKYHVLHRAEYFTSKLGTGIRVVPNFINNFNIIPRL